MAKKILFVYYQNIKPGGVSKVLSNLTDELVARGYEVEILFLVAEHKDFYPINPKIKKHYLDSFGHSSAKLGVKIHKKYAWLPKSYNIYSYLYDFAAYKTLKEWMDKNYQNYDLIVSCWYKLSAMLAVTKKFAPKTIAWEHMSYTSGGIFWNKTMRPYYKNLKAIVSTNKPGENYYKSLNPSSVTIYNPMDAAVEAQNFIAEDRKQNLITLVARLSGEKNIGEFVDIIAKSDLPQDWSVTIVGGGPDENLIRQKVLDKNLSRKITMTGNLSMPEVYELLSKSKINCLTSKNEALPTILIQAMFFSNALVAYDCQYGPSDIINDQNGFLIPMHSREMFVEKLNFLTKNPEELDQLMKSAYEESKKWKKEKILEQWEQILNPEL